jgi:topoisomerase IV subunit A
VVSVSVINPTQMLTLYSGKRHITLKMSDLEHYKGERGRRGNKLPRGFQKVDAVEVTDK